MFNNTTYILNECLRTVKKNYIYIKPTLLKMAARDGEKNSLLDPNSEEDAAKTASNKNVALVVVVGLVIVANVILSLTSNSYSKVHVSSDYGLWEPTAVYGRNISIPACNASCDDGRNITIPIIQHMLDSSQTRTAFYVAMGLEWASVLIYFAGALLTTTIIEISPYVISIPCVSTLVNTMCSCGADAVTIKERGQRIAAFLASVLRAALEVAGVLQLTLYVVKLKAMTGNKRSGCDNRGDDCDLGWLTGESFKELDYLWLAFAVYLIFHNVTRMGLRDYNFTVLDATQGVVNNNDKPARKRLAAPDDWKPMMIKGGLDEAARRVLVRFLDTRVTIGNWLSHLITKQLIPCMLTYGFLDETSVIGRDNMNKDAWLLRYVCIIIFCQLSFRSMGAMVGYFITCVDYVGRAFPRLDLLGAEVYLKIKDSPYKFEFAASREEKTKMLTRSRNIVNAAFVL